MIVSNCKNLCWVIKESAFNSWWPTAAAILTLTVGTMGGLEEWGGGRWKGHCGFKRVNHMCPVRSSLLCSILTSCKPCIKSSWIDKIPRGRCSNNFKFSLKSCFNVFSLSSGYISCIQTLSSLVRTEKITGSRLRMLLVKSNVPGCTYSVPLIPTLFLQNSAYFNLSATRIWCFVTCHEI